MGKQTLKVTLGSLRNILPLILMVTSVLIYPAPCNSEPINLLTPLGERIGYSSIKGKQYTLLYIVKPWDGVTSKLLKELQKIETSFYGRIKPVIVFTNTRRAVANAYMAKLKFRITSHYIDDTFALALKINPSTLPCCLLESANGVEVIRTSSPEPEFLRQLTINPGRYIRILKKQKTGEMKASKHIHEVHSPWGPPHVKVHNEEVKN